MINFQVGCALVFGSVFALWARPKKRTVLALATRKLDPTELTRKAKYVAILVVFAGQTAVILEP